MKTDQEFKGTLSDLASLMQPRALASATMVIIWHRIQALSWCLGFVSGWTWTNLRRMCAYVGACLRLMCLWSSQCLLYLSFSALLKTQSLTEPGAHPQWLQITEENFVAPPGPSIPTCLPPDPTRLAPISVGTLLEYHLQEALSGTFLSLSFLLEGWCPHAIVPCEV